MEVFGRYECIDPSKNHNKFWHIVVDRTNNKVYATWGRIGNRSPTPKEYTIAQAEKKVREKIKKGYVKRDGFLEEVGHNSLNFILEEICEG